MKTYRFNGRYVAEILDEEFEAESEEDARRKLEARISEGMGEFEDLEVTVVDEDDDIIDTDD